nr:ribosomal L7Ae/L30e/S12e/Gadd45 family protein [bacterium]
MSFHCIEGLLGLAARAGRVVAGANAVEAAIRKKRVKLLVLDGGAGEATSRKFSALAAQAGIPVLTGSEKGAGQAAGAPGCVVIAITSLPMAQGMIKRFSAQAAPDGVQPAR